MVLVLSARHLWDLPEKKHFPVSWYHSFLSLVEPGSPRWRLAGVGVEKKHPIAQLCIYYHLPPLLLSWWLPIRSCFIGSCIQFLEFPEHHFTWRAAPMSLWAVMRLPFQSHTGPLSFIPPSLLLAALISPRARVYSAVFSSALQAICHRRLSQPNWNSLDLSFCPVRWANVCIWHFSHGDSLTPLCSCLKWKTSEVLQKNCTFSCNLKATALCWIFTICWVLSCSQETYDVLGEMKQTHVKQFENSKAQ